jgi:MmeI, DNA-methyltransferase domain/MmeI, target recognition domain/MmeI, N-terminal domain/MmeI, C-terminal domain/MmeI, helicase spacer domain
VENQKEVTPLSADGVSSDARQRALKFIQDWKGESREQAEAKPFWVDFFSIFGIKRRRVAAFEHPVKKADGHTGFIDLLWPGVILIEHKSLGENLDKAMIQAKGYLKKLPPSMLPQCVLLCDFERFLLKDLDNDTTLEFTLAQLPDRLGHFNFFFGDKTKDLEDQAPITVEAVDALDQLHNDLAKAGYAGHDLEIFLVRTLYCLFAEDTGIFGDIGTNRFTRLIEEHTNVDGSDVGALLNHLFQILNTAPVKRSKSLPEHLQFPYINGQLFAESTQIPDFDAPMRQKLIECAKLDWSYISPAVFGALFQGIMDKQSRRKGGAHYTSERNILKVIEPLFLDGLWLEFEDSKSSIQKLKNFHAKLQTLNFLDPACGCGNFLVVTYRELRVLELEVIQELNRAGHLWTKTARNKPSDREQLVMDAADVSKVNVDQFHGIEIDEFPVQIARVAMWLTDHLENRRLEKTFGRAYARIPLVKSAHIVQGNALQVEWETVLPSEKCAAVMGNPPFVGKNFRSEQQDVDMAGIAGAIPKWKSVDFVANWHIKALGYIQGTTTPVGFVSTNSICQGEQVSALWPYLLENGLKLNFAHRAFAWANEAKGKAGVHCIILGFSLTENHDKSLWSYDDPQGDGQKQVVRNISPYLIAGPNTVVHPRSTPVCEGVPAMVNGSKPTDDGHYQFTKEQKGVFLDLEPGASQFFRRCIGAEEFINGKERWCLWLKDAEPGALRKLPQVLKRIEAVREFRGSSTKEATKKDAGRAAEWQEMRHNGRPYILVPCVSSEARTYIPIGFMSPEFVANNRVLMIPNAGLYDLGILSSAQHMAWTRVVTGRLESRFNYSANIVYNNFPWPERPTDKRRHDVETTAQAVINARAQFPSSTLADLYDPLTMPAALLKAHAALDKAVDLCYRSQLFADERKRVEFLLERYERLTKTVVA